jgi:CBS domain containing-hemolysin-like protein
LINNLLKAGATEIVKIMTPRSRTVFLNADLGVPEMIERFRRAKYSRVPVYCQNRDNLVGFLYAEDVLRFHLDRTDLTTLSLEEIVRPPIVVPLTKKVDEMFDFFVKNNARAAAVLNEFGGVTGFITINDVLRYIFGPLIQRVAVETLIRKVGPRTYEMPGDTKLGEVNRVLNVGVYDPRMTTIGGVTFRHLDRLPRVGDKLAFDGVSIEVLTMKSHRIAEVRLIKGNGDSQHETSNESSTGGEPGADESDLPAELSDTIASDEELQQ